MTDLPPDVNERIATVCGFEIAHIGPDSFMVKEWSDREPHNPRFRPNVDPVAALFVLKAYANQLGEGVCLKYLCETGSEIYDNCWEAQIGKQSRHYSVSLCHAICAAILADNETQTKPEET